MDNKKSTQKLMSEFMRLFSENEEEDQTFIWDKLNEIVDSAKLDVINDAENLIGKLRTFSS